MTCRASSAEFRNASVENRSNKTSHAEWHSVKTKKTLNGLMSPIQGVKPHAQGSETLSMNRSCKIPHLCEESHYWQVSIRNGTHSSFSREKAKVRVSPAKQITVKETSQIRFKLTKGFDHLRSSSISRSSELFELSSILG